MKRLKNGLVSSASLSFIGSLTYMIISGLIGGIFEKTLSETVIIHWIFIYIPLIAATIFFFRLRGTVDKKNTNDDISLSRCLPIWMISFPFASFIVSRPYGSLVSFAKSGNTPFSDYLYICLISFVFTFVLTLFISKAQERTREIAAAKEREEERKRQEEGERQYAEWKRQHDIQMAEEERKRQITQAEEERKRQIAQAEEEKRIAQKDKEIRERILLERNTAEQRMANSPLVQEIALCILPYYKNLIDQADRQSHMKIRVRLMIKVLKDSIIYCDPSDINNGKAFLFEEEGIAEKLTPILREALCKTLITELRRLLFETYPSDPSGQKVQIGLEQEDIFVSNKTYIRGRIETCPEYDDDSYAYAVMQYQTFESKGDRYF